MLRPVLSSRAGEFSHEKIPPERPASVHVSGPRPNYKGPPRTLVTDMTEAERRVFDACCSAPSEQETGHGSGQGAED